MVHGRSAVDYDCGETCAGTEDTQKKIENSFPGFVRRCDQEGKGEAIGRPRIAVTAARE
jgi:hypothetical protein